MEKIHEFKSRKEALAAFIALESKLEELYKQNPVFWFDITLTSNNTGHRVVFINCGSLTKFNLDLDKDDLEVS